MILGSTLLAACVTAPGPGSQQGATPPQLVKEDNKFGWKNIESFGEVPSDKAALGEQTCAKLNTADTQFVATGYHTMAKDQYGNTLPQGGFYCVRK